MTLEQRIATLERANARLRRACAVALGLSLIAVVSHFGGTGSAAAPASVSAQEFVLLDAKGQKRGAWHANDGVPGLAMMSAAGNGVMMSASSDGASIAATTSRHSVVLSVDAETAMVSAKEENSDLSAAVGFTAGDARLFLSNRAGKMVSYPPSR